MRHATAMLLAVAACTSAETPDKSETGIDPEVTLRPALCDAPPFHATVSRATLDWQATLPASPLRFVTETRPNALEQVTTFEGEQGITDLLERGWFRLRDGRIDDAITDLEQALARALEANSPWRGRIRKVLATAWMRKAEVDNCIASADGGACLVPFGDQDRHNQTAGMTTAAAIWLDYLGEDEPDDPAAAWMLNLTALTLGTWPDSVPEAHRALESRMLSAVPMTPWPNVGHDIGLHEPDISGSTAIEDFDGNGYPDLMISNFDPRKTPRLMLQAADGTFCDASHATGLDEAGAVLNFSVADYDADGDIDLAMPRAAWYGADGLVPVLLYRNDGTGRFTEVSREAGLQEAVGPSQVALWADLNVDGRLDLIVGREAAGITAPPSLYLNQGDGTFLDFAAELGLEANAFVKGAAVGDLDADGLPDIYVSTFDGPNRVYFNRGSTFLEGAIPPEPTHGFAAWMFDPDQDGDLDVFGAGYASSYGTNGVLEASYGRSNGAYAPWILGRDWDEDTATILLNDGGRLADAGEAFGVREPHATMGASFGDLNNDGWPDIYLGTGGPDFDALEPNIAYLNQGGRAFTDVTSATELGHLQKGHGVTFGDIDGDGDEELFPSIGGAFRGDGFPDPVFLNPNDDAARVVIRLRGTTSNRDGIGARVAIETDTRTFYQWVGATGSFGNNSLALEQGLGASTEIREVRVQWPGGDEESVTGVRLGAMHVIEQGRGVIEVRDFAPRTLGGSDVDHSHDTALP
jgi:hypothetical protein